MSVFIEALNPPASAGDWNTIDWRKVERVVAGLQHRLVLAVKQGAKRKVRDLQRLITKSVSARLLAVRRVAQDNQGKRTPGVDGILWATSQERLEGAMSLTQWKGAKPLRRQWIPKANGKLRPLGIPTMRDRAFQAVWNLALLPVVETLSDPNFCGFRPFRGATDALNILRAKLARYDRTEWVLDADIEGCFDNISHDWLVANTPMEGKVLRAFLKAGVLENKVFSPTDIGTP